MLEKERLPMLGEHGIGSGYTQDGLAEAVAIIDRHYDGIDISESPCVLCGGAAAMVASLTLLPGDVDAATWAKVSTARRAESGGTEPGLPLLMAPICWACLELPKAGEAQAESFARSVMLAAVKCLCDRIDRRAAN